MSGSTSRLSLARMTSRCNASFAIVLYIIYATPCFSIPHARFVTLAHGQDENGFAWQRYERSTTEMLNSLGFLSSADVGDCVSPALEWSMNRAPPAAGVVSEDDRGRIALLLRAGKSSSSLSAASSPSAANTVITPTSSVSQGSSKKLLRGRYLLAPQVQKTSLVLYGRAR